MTTYKPSTQADYDDALERLPPVIQVTGRAGGFLLGVEIDTDEDGNSLFEAHLHRAGSYWVSEQPITFGEFRRVVRDESIPGEAAATEIGRGQP